MKKNKENKKKENEEKKSEAEKEKINEKTVVSPRRGCGRHFTG